MRKAIAAALLSSSLLSSPAFAVHGISYDGASMMLAYGDPYAIPTGDPTGVRYGTVNFRYSSVGQVNDGWVQYYTTIYPSDQLSGPFKIRFLPSPYQEGYLDPGGQCPDLAWALDNNAGDNSDGSLDSNQLQAWIDSNCSDRPDPHLYNSGSVMAIQLLLSSVDGGWLNAVWYWVAPMDGGQYNVTIFWGTGEAGVGSPYAKIAVSKRGGETGALADPDYMDASYNYASPNTGVDDGFDVQFSNVFWQGGCDTTDTSYVDTCITALTAEFWLQPANDAKLPDISPINTVMGFFLVPDDNSAAWLGSYGQMLMAEPPEIYNTGDDTTYLINAADVGFGLILPQTSISQAWGHDVYGNPNYTGLGAGIQAAGQDF